jgi:hypothetical protein
MPVLHSEMCRYKRRDFQSFAQSSLNSSYYEECHLPRCYAVWLRSAVSEELGASIIKVTRIGELGTTLAVTSNRRTLRRNAEVLAYLLLSPR